MLTKKQSKKAYELEQGDFLVYYTSELTNNDSQRRNYAEYAGTIAFVDLIQLSFRGKPELMVLVRLEYGKSIIINPNQERSVLVENETLERDYMMQHRGVPRKCGAISLE